MNTVSEQVPVLTFAGYFDKAGNAYSHLEETQFDEIIHQYNLLQYENLFGGVSEQVPVLTFAGYFDKAGNAYSHLEETQFDEIIHQYNLLQYENLFGGKTRNNGFFNEKAGEYKQ